MRYGMYTPAELKLFTPEFQQCLRLAERDLRTAERVSLMPGANPDSSRQTQLSVALHYWQVAQIRRRF